jgi:CheY-like chemotaxis protein
MEPDVVGRVFEQFYSHDSSSRRLHGGAGLGMTISKSIIDAMDGTIEITSSKGIGTLVRISLRLPLAGPGTAGERKPARASITGKRVLLVDDTPLVAEVTCAMLSQLGAVVDILNSGEEALSNKTLQEYDVILMDCQMPNLDGLQTAARLLEENPDADLRIIAFSAHDTEEFVAECLNAGMVHHIGKPFSAAVLIDAIQTFSR